MFDFFAHTPVMLSLLKRLAEIESPSHNKTGVDKVGALISEECRRLGGVVTHHPQTTFGDLVEARWGKGQDGILLLAHMDTVHPVGTIERTPFREVDDRVMGPGVEDMKGGIVIGLTALAAMVELHQAPTRPVTALFTSDEEIGSPTSRPLIESLARQSALVLVLEPAMPDGAIKTWRKGVGDFIVTVRGRAAHAGSDHQLGRNAIEELAHQILVIQNLTNYDRGTTLNVGVIRGGTATNVVPQEAVAEVDLRIMEPSEAKRIIATLHALKPAMNGTTISVSGELNRPPMPSNDIMKATFERTRKIAAGIGIELIASGTGGASDANFVAPLGIPVLDGLGAVGDGGHSEREFILKDSLPERAKLLATILREW
ncbi:MAG: M20 family metallopeptidase [Anaerolineales bacterium]|jgi:glutamate carboxypeptidase